MAQNIVGGLFGLQEQPDYSAQDYRTAIAMAEMNRPKQFGRFLGGMIGAPLGRAAAQGIAGLAGYEDPRIKQQKVLNAARQQGFDVSTPEGLQQLASFFVQNGEPGLAQQVASQALSQRQTAAQTMQAEENLQRGQQYRAAVAALQQNPDATEQDFINLARQFSSPEAGITAAIQAESRKELKAAEQDRKEQAVTEQQKAAAEMAFGRAGIVLDKAKQAYNMVNSRTTGSLGTALLAIPGSDATDMAGLIETIKSNLATSELQKIRDASKTGGALGNVSNKDITLLESAVASLSQKQSPEMLRKNLGEVIRLYTKIQEDAGIKIGQSPTQTPGIAPTPSAPASSAGWSIVSTK